MTPATVGGAIGVFGGRSPVPTSLCPLPRLYEVDATACGPICLALRRAKKGTVLVDTGRPTFSRMGRSGAR